MKMKSKLFLIVGLVCVCGLTAPSSARAAESVYESFLKVTSVTISNTIPLTNLLSAVSGSQSNVTGLIYTNLPGDKITVGTTTNASGDQIGRYLNLANTLPLYFDDSGGIPGFKAPSIDTGPYTNWQGSAQVVVSIVGGSGANVANSLAFVPVYGDERDLNTSSSIEAPAADQWVFAITPSGATPVTIVTNVPRTRWPAAVGLRLKYVTPGDTDASSQVTYTKIGLQQVRP